MTATALERWQGMHVWKQGELDFLCGAYCTLTAAGHFGTYPVSTLKSPLRVLDKPSLALTRGMYPDDIADFADAVGLRLDRKKQAPSKGEFGIAFVRVEFAPGESDGHYVLVLEQSARHVVIADPHPRRTSLQHVKCSTFNRWCKAAGDDHWYGVLTPFKARKA